MKIVLISSSLSPQSVSAQALGYLASKIPGSTLLDLKKLDLKPYWRSEPDTQVLQTLKEADGIIVGGGVYNYSINDSLKVFIDNYFDQNLTHKPIGMVLAGGSPRSFLVWQHLAQIFMNEWHMFVWPHTLYVHKTHFDHGKIVDEEVQRRFDYFADNFPFFVEKIRDLKNKLD